MISPESNNADAWTGMPIELDALESATVTPDAIQAALPKSTSRFDLKNMFWKFFASANANTDPAVLAALATDEQARIRKRVAENVSTPADTLALLAEDNETKVREAVARNPHTPVYILRTLASDEEVDVRFAIASNPEMPDAILLSLFLDPDPFVAERASQTLAA